MERINNTLDILEHMKNISSDTINFNNSFYYGEESLYSPSTAIVVLLSFFYGAISLVAVVGNSTVILIVLTSRRMQSVTNFFIANLALADVIIGLFAIPFQFQAALLQQWNLPSFLCPFCPFFKNLSVNASIFTLTAIAVDRYKAIMFPLKSQSSKSKTKGVIVIIWVLSTFLAVPMAIAFRTQDVMEMEENEPELIQCIPVNISIPIFMWYKNFLCLVQYFIPLILISGAYIRMAITLWSTQTPGAAHMERDRTVMANKKKVIKMLMLVVALFTLAWLPFQFYEVIIQIFPEINYYPYINLIYFSCDWLSMSNSCYNPFIYILCNEKFKKELRVKLSCCPGNKGNRQQRSSLDYTNTTIWRSGDTLHRRGGRKMKCMDINPVSETTALTRLSPENNYECPSLPTTIIPLSSYTPSSHSVQGNGIMKSPRAMDYNLSPSLDQTQDNNTHLHNGGPAL